MAQILVASVDTLPRMGGVSMMTHHFANAVVRHGHDVTVLGPRDASIPPDMSAQYELVADERSDPGRREGPEWTIGEHPKVLARIKRLWARHDFNRAIALHPNYFGLPLLEAARQNQVGMSAVFHGYELRSQLMKPAKWRAMRLQHAGLGPSLRDLTLNLARGANEILVNSQYTANLVQRTGSKAPIRVIGCGLDLEEARTQIDTLDTVAREQRERIRKILDIPLDAPVIGTLGRLVESKNPAHLVELLCKYPSAYALIVGDGPEREAIFELARRKRVTSRLRLVTAVSEVEKWPILRAMDVFCLLSSEKPAGQVEGFGIVLLEAACAGIPVIAARSGGMVDVVEDKVSGRTVAGGDITALNRAARTLVQSPEIAAEYVSVARAGVLNRFNMQAITASVLAGWGMHQAEGAAS